MNQKEINDTLNESVDSLQRVLYTLRRNGDVETEHKILSYLVEILSNEKQNIEVIYNIKEVNYND